MIYRNALIEANQRLGEIPAIAILGPRQTGKKLEYRNRRAEESEVIDYAEVFARLNA